MDRNSKPKWINPANLDMAALAIDENSSQNVMPNADLLTMLFTKSQNSLQQARGFKDEYVFQTFHITFDEQHEAWKATGYDWLPQPNKKLGQSTTMEVLKALKLDPFLKDTYRNLQTYAAALEQVVWDLGKEDDEQRSFLNEFKAAFDEVIALLSEFQTAMIERYVKPYPDVLRDVMSEEFRSMPEETSRMVRDWIIFRDYINTLEFVKDALVYFKANL